MQIIIIRSNKKSKKKGQDSGVWAGYRDGFAVLVFETNVQFARLKTILSKKGWMNQFIF